MYAFVYLFVDFCKLFQVVLQKGDLLFLSSTAPCIIRVHLSALQKTYILLLHLSFALHLRHTQTLKFSVKGTIKAKFEF
jgi:hypothetical protein